MRLSTIQVAEKLGISDHTVRVYRDQGKLIDIAARKEGAAKHFSYFDSKQVNEFAKTFIPGGKIGPRRRAVPEAKPAAAGGIMTRLEAIEAKVDRLLKLWE